VKYALTPEGTDMKRAFKYFLARAVMALRVNSEALWLAPGEYLTAVKWRLLCKRVRARGQFAVLLGRTSRAYEWRSLMDGAGGRLPSPPGSPSIIALVQEVGAPSQADVTMASLAADNVVAYLISAEPAQALIDIAATIDWSASPWFMPIAAGDRITPGAAQAYRDLITGSPFRAIYADDDHITTGGHRTKPHYKPDWNADLHRHHDYVTGACIITTDRVAFEQAANAQNWAVALVQGAVLAGGGASHIRQVLHHRRNRPAPCLPLPALNVPRELPRVSVIIPTRNRLDLLSTCIAGLASADYSDLEVIVVDNDSEDPATLDFLETLQERGMRVLRHAGPFNYSAINNRAVAEATGDLVCLLNNDVAMLSPDWLTIMATQALRDDVGAVGAQLLYPDGRIQHAGVVIGVGNAAGHAHRFLRPDDAGYFRRHALPQFVSAVTAACLVVRRDRFLAVGALDETRFPVAFNDVDLCLRLNERGWQSFYEPRAVLVHHESVSRGFDRDPVRAARFAGELAALQERWRTNSIVDPFHHPMLSRASEQFVIGL
jgi:O-antigen biosynthesis protein